MKKPNASEQGRVERLYKNIHQTKVIYERWLAGNETVISTSAGGVVALATVANSALISSTSDFSSLAALYTAYRCKAIRVQLIAVMNAPAYNGTTLRLPPAAVSFFPWTSNTVPTTYQQSLDVSGVKVISGFDHAVVSTTNQGDPDAKLWTGTGGAITNSEQFGISCVGTSQTASASVGVWIAIPQYLVQFRMTG